MSAPRALSDGFFATPDDGRRPGELDRAEVRDSHAKKRAPGGVCAGMRHNRQYSMLDGSSAIPVVLLLFAQAAPVKVS